MTDLTDAEIIKLLGGAPAVARMLNIKPPSVYEWVTDGMPEYRLRELAAQIEIKSGGRFTRMRRWPDNYAFYWPELAQAQINSAQAAPETIAVAESADKALAALAPADLPPIVDLPPITADAGPPEWNGIDRRAPVSFPVPPELDRRAALDGGE